MSDGCGGDAEMRDVAYDLEHWARIADRMAASDYAEKHGGLQFGVTNGNNCYLVEQLDMIRGPVLYSTAAKPEEKQPARMQCFAVYTGGAK